VASPGYALSVRSVVLVPTYNERENVRLLLEGVRRNSPDSEIVVVDDNSPDGTADEVRAVADELGNIRLIVRPDKDGLGSAYRHGFDVVLAEDYDAVVTMDVDLSHDPVVIPVMLRLIEDGADAVIGSRYVPGGGTVNWPVHRRMLSRWGNRYTAAMLGLAARDCTSGFRAYRAPALAAIDPASTSAEGYAFLTELVRRLVANGMTIEETPITFVDRRFGQSKMSGRIVAESMLLVTAWGLRDRWLRLRGRSDQRLASRTPSAE
jgi:dolichol-phosphate mannosyltransferase